MNIADATPASANQKIIVVVDGVKMPNKKITKKTKLNEILQKNPEVAKILFESGLGCIGCPMAMQETLEEGCLAHGFSNKEVEELVKKLNKK